MKELGRGTLATIIETTGLTNQFLVLFSILSLCCFTEGYCYISNVLIGPILRDQMLTPAVESLVKSFYIVGLILSVPCCAFFPSRSKKTIISTFACLAFLAGIIYKLHTSIYCIYLGNFAIGLSVGSIIVVGSSLASEICSKHYRTYCLTWSWMFLPIGEIAACLVSEYFNVYEKPSNITYQKLPYIFLVNR